MTDRPLSSDARRIVNPTKTSPEASRLFARSGAMTFVGKVLVVVQLVLSLCFMAFAGAVFSVQQNWRAHADGLSAELEAERTAITDLEADYDRYKDEMTAELSNEKDRADGAEHAAEVAEQKLRDMETDFDTAKAERDAQTALAMNASEEAKIRLEEATALHEVNADLHRTANDLSSTNRSLKDEIFNRDIREENLVAKNERLLDRYKESLAKEGKTDALKIVPQSVAPPAVAAPDVKGKVVLTQKDKRNSSELVQISIGSDDGLTRGHTLAVYRETSSSGKAGMYLGEIELVLVRPDQAVGQVIQAAKNGEIEVGDNVTTKL
jgi:hypothetical protein